MSRSPIIAASLLALLLVGACGSNPAPSSPGADAAVPTATPAASGSTSASTVASGGATQQPALTPAPTPEQSTTGGPAPTPRFTLTTAAFHAGGSIPARFTCDGQDVSPAMAWSGTPAGTKSLVLIADDLDAHSFTHWIAYAISPGTTRLAEGAGAANSTRLAQGTNDFGHVGYGGPCPPSGTHRYVFTLYALAARLGLSGAPRAAAVRAALAEAQIIGKATITARYSR